jgi:hypothetical protein
VIEEMAGINKPNESVEKISYEKTFA